MTWCCSGGAAKTAAVPEWKAEALPPSGPAMASSSAWSPSDTLRSQASGAPAGVGPKATALGGTQPPLVPLVPVLVLLVSVLVLVLLVLLLLLALMLAAAGTAARRGGAS